MTDFFQNGLITTLHDLGDRPLDQLEAELVDWARSAPMTLVIPTLFSELEGEALGAIVDELVEVPYLDEVIIGLDRADAEQFARARRFFEPLPMRTRLLWNDGPRLLEFDGLLAEHDLAPTEAGKGRNVWYCLGYFLASGRGRIVALHDADVLTYSRRMLARLLYPIAHPTFGYAFCKGYYYRADATTLNGRVARLMVAPLVRALRQTVGPLPYLDYLDSFRYPLAGESAMAATVVRNLRIPSDWGIEIGLLGEVYRRYTTRRICQVDLGGPYDHKHQELSADDPRSGLHKMSIDIAKAMYRKLAIGGSVFSPEVFRTVKAAYYRGAVDLVEQYHNDAVLNGYSLDRHSEEAMVELFAQAIMTAGEAFLSEPMDTPFIASWARVVSAVPDAFERLSAAVEADNSG